MLPEETINAIFPPRGRGELRLYPVALAHVTAMEVFGVDLDYDVNADNALIAAWVLSQPAERMKELVEDTEEAIKDYVKWSKGINIEPQKIAEEVNADLRLSFSTFIKAKPPKEQINKQQLYKTGLGFPLEFAEWLSSEYGMTFEDALSVPLIRVYALLACARQRNRLEHGAPDYYERLMVKDMKSDLDRLRELKHRQKKGSGHGE